MTSDGERWALPPLTANNRCDWPACCASAVLRIITAAGDLYACAHHYERNAARLNAAARYVQDERLAPRTDTEGLEDVGRMHMRRGLTHADPCRWCLLRLRNVRLFDGVTSAWREYFLCEVCDETAADMDSLKGLTFE